MSFYDSNTLTDYIKDYEDPAALPFDNSVDNFDIEDSRIEEEQEQKIIFDNLNEIQNPVQISPEEEEDLHRKAYFYQKKFEKADHMKLLDMLNNPADIEEKPELPKEENKIQPVKKEEKETKAKVVLTKKKTKPFEEKKCRDDYLIKKFKTHCFSKYARKKINSMIKMCQFQGRLKNAKIYLADHKAFTADSNLKRNNVFLSMKLRDIYTMSSDNNRKNENKKGKNEEIFNKIDASTNYLNPQAYDELIDYLNKTVKEVIIEFYGTDEFKKFKKENEQANRAFMQEKKFSFMENDGELNGFLKLILNKY